MTTIFGVVVAILLSATMTARADAGPSTVALDWTGVPQDLIDRCGLGGLENLLLEAIIDSGFAVVADSGRQQMTLELRGEAAGISINAKPSVCVRDSGSIDCVARGRVAIGRKCDGTIAIEIIRVAKEKLRGAVLSAPVPPDASVAPAHAVLVVEAEVPAVPLQPPREPWRFAASLGVSIPGGHVFAPMLRAEVARDLPGRLVIAANLGASLWHKLGLWVVEPTAGAQLRQRVPIGSWELAFGIGADLLVHAYKYEGASAGALVTGRLGIPLELAFSRLPLALAVLPNVRLEAIRHRVYGEVAFASERLACDVALKWFFD